MFCFVGQSWLAVGEALFPWAWGAGEVLLGLGGWLSSSFSSSERGETGGGSGGRDLSGGAVVDGVPVGLFLVEVVEK